MQGKANVLGHPVHLMLVSFPVAYWTGALVTDSAGVMTHDPFFFRMSVMLIAMGTLGGLAASLPGFIDYFTTPMSPQAKVVATRHLLWSAASIATFAVAWFFRAYDPASSRGIVLTLGGAIALLAAGFFGSELSSRFGVGVRARNRRPKRAAKSALS